MAEEQKLKTRCYYTDYVNHMIRFYLSTPEHVQIQGKRKADIDNWLAVQSVWYRLPDKDKEVLTTIYCYCRNVPEGVKKYCEETGADLRKTWILVTKTCAAIAKRRGLV